MKKTIGIIWVCVIALLNLQCAKPADQPASPQDKTLLAIFAHPDDEATVAPVLAKYAAEGVTVYLAIATDGRYGVTDHAKIPAGDSLATVREEEAKCAAEKLGIQPPIFFKLHDQLKMGLGMAAIDGELNVMRERVKELFISLKPDVIITWGASGWTGHHDHRLVSTVVTEVFQTQKRDKPAQLYYSAIPSGNFPINGPLELATVDSTFLPIKISISDADYAKALASWHCHKSQYTPETIEGMHQLLTSSLKGTAYFMPVAVPSQEKNSLF